MLQPTTNPKKNGNRIVPPQQNEGLLMPTLRPPPPQHIPFRAPPTPPKSTRPNMSGPMPALILLLLLVVHELLPLSYLSMLLRAESYWSPPAGSSLPCNWSRNPRILRTVAVVKLHPFLLLPPIASHQAWNTHKTTQALLPGTHQATKGPTWMQFQGSLGNERRGRKVSRMTKA